MKKTLGDYIVLLISIIGSFASIIAFGLYFKPLLNKQGWVGVFFLGLLVFILIGYLFYLISKYRKEVRYTAIHSDLNICQSVLHEIDREDIKSGEEIINRLKEVCNSISSAFSNINGHHIGVCIKFLTFEERGPLVLTLLRDKNSSYKNRKSGKSDKTRHWLNENSDFEFIYSNFDNDNIDTTFYYRTKLPIRRDYKNSRLCKETWPPKIKLSFLNNVKRRKYWPLPYRSTIVVPIVPLVANKQNQKAIRGFLCIDSPENIAFNKEVDVEILKGISDGLYNKIDKLHEIINN